MSLLLCLGNEADPAVVIPGNALFVLLKIERKLQRTQAKNGVGSENLFLIWIGWEQSRVAHPADLGIDPAQLGAVDKVAYFLVYHVKWRKKRRPFGYS